MFLYNSIFLCCFISQTLIYIGLSNTNVLPYLNSQPTESASIIKWLCYTTEFYTDQVKQQKITDTLTFSFSSFVFELSIFKNIFPNPSFSLNLSRLQKKSTHHYLSSPHTAGPLPPSSPSSDPTYNTAHLLQQYPLVFPTLSLSGG